MKIAICGGHVTPAIAVIEAIKRQNPKTDFIYLGRYYPLEGERAISFEFEQIKKLKIKFINITSGRLQRRFTKYTLLSLSKLPVGILQTFTALIKFKPNLLISFGGYLSVPAVISAWLLQIPIVIHEQTASAGLANRYGSKFAKSILIAYPQSKDLFPSKKIHLIGNPLRSEIFKTKAESFQIEQFLKTAKTRKLIYVTGGSLGSHFINKQILELLPFLLSKYALIIQIGISEKSNDQTKFKKRLQKFPKGISKYCHLSQFIESCDIGAILNQADLVISRAGANTISEIMALAKVAILIPLPFAGAKEQEQNAKLIKNIGAGIIIPQSELTSKVLVGSIGKIFENYKLYQKSAYQAQKVVKFDSADVFAKIALSNATYD